MPSSETPAPANCQPTPARTLPRPAVLTNYPGSYDINVGWTLLSGYLVFFMQASPQLLIFDSMHSRCVQAAWRRLGPAALPR